MLAARLESWAVGEGYTEFRRRLLDRRATHSPAGTRVRRWLPIAALIPLLVTAALVERLTENIQADELIELAARHQGQRPPGVLHRVRVQFTPLPVDEPRRLGTMTIAGPFWFVRTVVDGIAADSAGAATALYQPPAATVVTLSRFLSDHHMDWCRPLNMADFLAWHSSRAGRSDRVSRVSSELLQLRTIAADGVLREARLTVRRENYRPIEQVLIFEGIGRLVMAEEMPPTPYVLAAETHVTVRPTAPERDALDQAELDARLVLRAANLDLGGLHVSPTPAMVRVTGTVTSAIERRRVEARLAGRPLVEVALRVSVTPKAPDALASSREDVADTPDHPEGGLLGAHRGESSLATLRPSIVGVRQHLSVMNDLAQRFPATGRTTLSPVAHVKLKRLLALHYRALRASLDGLDEQLTARFRFAGRRVLPLAETPADWQRRTAEGLTFARTLEGALQRLRLSGTSPLERQQSDDLREISSALDALWEVINAGGVP